MKKMAIALTLTLVTALAFGAVGTAYAAQDTRDIALTYVHTVKNDPSFIITIPSAIELTADGTAAAITVSEMKDMDGKIVSLTLAGTSQSANHLAIKHNTYLQFAYYSITLPSREVVKNDNPSLLGGTAFAGNEPVNYLGKELLNFTDDSTKVLTFTALARDALYVGDTYSGSITFGIAVV